MLRKRRREKETHKARDIERGRNLKKAEETLRGASIEKKNREKMKH